MKKNMFFICHLLKYYYPIESNEHLDESSCTSHHYLTNNFMVSVIILQLGPNDIKLFNARNNLKCFPLASRSSLY
jgi:hypothetical protein